MWLQAELPTASILAAQTVFDLNRTRLPWIVSQRAHTGCATSVEKTLDLPGCNWSRRLRIVSTASPVGKKKPARRLSIVCDACALPEARLKPTKNRCMGNRCSVFSCVAGHVHATKGLVVAYGVVLPGAVGVAGATGISCGLAGTFDGYGRRRYRCGMGWHSIHGQKSC